MKNSIQKYFRVISIALLIVVHSNVKAQSFTERGVSFQNGSVEFQGTLLLPDVQGQVPAIVYLHGSGPMTRKGFRPYAEEFAKLGIASLFYDKRGTGSSGGSWTTSSLNDLATDGLAAVQYLKEEEQIDSNRIGFWGISQAGWIAPKAASQSEDIAFMILISGGGASPKESEYYSYEKIFEQHGLSKETKSEAFEIIDIYFQYLATGEERSRLSSRLERLENDPENPLHQLPQIIRVPSEENRSNWSWVATYDPVPDIAKVDCPVLLMFGDQDKEQPTKVAVEKWRQGLEKAGNNQTTIMVFPEAGHGIRMGRHGSNGERPSFADGYQEVQIGWLWKHVVNNEK